MRGIMTKHPFYKYLFLFLFLYGVSPSTPAYAVEIEVVSPLNAIQTTDSFWIGFLFTLKEGEKVQGYPDLLPTLTWQGSQNIKTASLPEKLLTQAQHQRPTFNTSFVLPVQVHLKQGVAVTLSGTIGYVLCKDDQCTPCEHPFHLEIPTGAETPSLHAKVIEKAAGYAIEGNLEQIRNDTQWRPPSLAPPQVDHTLMQLLLWAFIGGMILNLMPCVLPVLALKFISVASSKVSQRPRLGHIATILGIFTSFWLFATLAALLKSMGQQIGWGVHFQQPSFLVFMILIMAGFSANLLGLFEIQLPQSLRTWLVRLWPSTSNSTHKPQHPTRQLWNNYGSGILATLLATPCTAPFLGVSIGFALTHDIIHIFLILTTVALGFSTPYWLLILLPSRWIPRLKPGLWMLWIKKFLGVCLLLTAAWIGFILYDNLSSSPSSDIHENEAPSKEGWETFHINNIHSIIAKGKVVLVNITATWCLTCHINGQFLSQLKELKTLTSEKKIVLLEADWTRPDTSITQFLTHFGRSGIPFTVVYGPLAPQGIVLPELLTKQKVFEALHKAGLIHKDFP